MSDLSTVLQTYVDRSEPLLPPDPGPAIDHGRVRVRTRRVAGAATATTALVVAGALVIPHLGSGPDVTGHGQGVDPATTAALAHYDPQAMPGIMADRVGAVLGRHLPDLPAPDFFASDDDGALVPAHYDRASTMSVVYGTGTDHVEEVSLSHSRSAAEGNARQNCADDVDSHVYLSCDVTVTPAGDLVISRVTALRPMHDLVDQAPTWRVVYTNRLDRADPTKLWFSHDVKVVHSQTFLTYASEIVKAPDLDTADERFAVPVADLIEIGTDPGLVIPEPS